MNKINTGTRTHQRWITTAIRLMFACICFALSTNAVQSADPISTRGNQVLYGGTAKAYAGNSFFWSNTGWGAERFYNSGAVSWLKNDWNSKIVRAAMGVEDAGGYLSDPQGNMNRVKAVVNAAIAEDIYVIIDWHSHRAENYTNQAVNFFRQMAQTYGNSNNVIYEIYNEPINSSWSGQIKPYAQSVIAAIRAIDPDNLIVVGTPFYSQNVDQTAADPIRGYANIAYSLHFYAGTHSQSLRNKAKSALNSGIPLFVTEWGAVNADGNGAVATDETYRWIDFMKQNNLSHVNWSVHDKQEGASSLRPGVSSTGGWGQSNLTASGRLVRSIMLDYNKGDDDDNPIPPPPSGGSCGGNAVNIPGTIQAESYCNMSGIQSEFSADAGGGRNIGYIHNNDWSEYSVNVPSSGAYALEIRVASATSGGTIDILSNNNKIGSVRVNGTGGWQVWQSKTTTVQLGSGRQNIRLNYVGGNGFLLNVNWFKISTTQNPPNPSPPPTGSSNEVDCTYVINNEWDAGFNSSIIITNNSNRSITGNWSVSWSYRDGSKVANGWNAQYSGNNPYTATPLSYNRIIEPGVSLTFGMQNTKGRLGAPAIAPTVTGSICN